MRASNPLTFGHAAGKPIKLAGNLRDHHLYVCGASGTGKSKFLEHLIRQDIDNRYKTGCGLLLLDWHGAVYDSIIRWLAWHDMYSELPLVPIDLRRDESVVSYHLLRHRKGAYASVIVGTLLQDLAYAWGQTDTKQTPRFARIAGDVLHVLYENGLTLADAGILATRLPTPLRIALTEKINDPHVKDDWKFLNSLRAEKAEEYFESTINRLRSFIANPLMRHMFGQDEPSFDWRTAIDEGHIVLVSFAKGQGKVTAQDCETCATLLLSDLWSAAQARDKSSSPKPFYVYMDEFQHFVTPTIAENLDEARGFGLHLTMANQYPSQLLDRGLAGQRVYNSVMANAATKVVFRTAHEADLDPLSRELFMGDFDPDEIKLVLKSTKVMDYEENVRYVTSNTESESEGESTPRWDIDDENPDSGHVSTGRSRVETEIEQHYSRPVFGQEVSSVQYRSLEEQIQTAKRRINTLRKRHCIARLAESHIPVPFRTDEVEDGWAEKKRVGEYTKKALKRWKFVVPWEKAEKNLEERLKKLEQDVLCTKNKASDDGEPTVFRRRVR